MRGPVRIALTAAVALVGLVAWVGPASAGTVTPAAQWNQVSATAAASPDFLAGRIRTKTDWGDVQFYAEDAGPSGVVCLKLVYPDGLDIPGSATHCIATGETADWGILWPTEFRLAAQASFSSRAGTFTGSFYY